jgi:CheY-like chemotaxis protein
MSGIDPMAAMFPGSALDGAGDDREATLILEVLGQGLCVADHAGNIAWANRVFRGFSRRLRGRVAAACTKAVADFASHTKTAQRKTRIHLSRGDRDYEVIITSLATSNPLCAALPTRGAAVALVRDVTAQERLRRKINAIDQAGAELVKIDADTIETLHVADRLRLLETKVVRVAHDLLHFDHFNIRVLNDRTNELELVMATGLSEKALAIKLYATASGNGISGHVAATGKPYICADTGKDPLYVFGLESCGSSLTVPLRLFDKTLGVFNVESDKTSGFTEHDRQFAEIFGRYVAMALYILNLLLVERYTTSKKATGNVQGELSEPLNDLTVDAEALKDQTMDPAVLRQVERVLKDVDALKKRVKSVAAGPSTLLGADDAIESSDIDPALRGKRLLVVDNEPEVSGIIRDVLARRGMEVTVCDDGASAVKLMLQWQVTQDPDQGYDVIVSDINLGDATGYDVFAAAKAASVSVPVILMTGFGYDPHHSIVRASQEGLQCVLFKPFQAEKLIEEVKKALTGPGGPAIM